MTDLVFVDSNVLVYRRDASEVAKQPQAAAWIEHLWRTRSGRLSIQVLQEYYQVVTRRLKPGLSPSEARQEVRELMTWRPAAMDAEVVSGAWEIEDRYGLSFWDALIVSAALRTGCRRLLTEDLQAGQELDGVLVVDPFQTAPA